MTNSAAGLTSLSGPGGSAWLAALVDSIEGYRFLNDGPAKVLGYGASPGGEVLTNGGFGSV